jgi:hypothetical protein
LKKLTPINFQLGLFEINGGQYHLKSSQSVADSKQYMQNEFGVSESDMEQFWKEWRTVWLEQSFFRMSQ